MFTSSLYLVALLFCLVASWITRKLGRKTTLLFRGLLFCSGAVINGFAQNVIMLIVGRILLGLGIRFANQAVPLYLSEMAPYKYTGALNIGFQLSITIGILIANILNYFFAQIKGGWEWRLSLGGAVVPALLIIIGSLCLPETPNSMIENGKVEQAKAQLVRIGSLYVHLHGHGDLSDGWCQVKLFHSKFDQLHRVAAQSITVSVNCTEYRYYFLWSKPN